MGNKMMVDEVFHEIVRNLDLGRLTSPPVKVSGGYMHKMYKIETQAGAYAVKLLNPCVMKRPDALPNFQRAEQLEEVLYEHGLPVVPAIGINGRKMQFLNGQYYYVFHWVEGRALRWNEIKAEHCGTAGALLAAIHKIERREKPCNREMLCADWDRYIAQAVSECPKTAKELKAVRDLLYSGQEAYNLALQQLPRRRYGQQKCPVAGWETAHHRSGMPGLRKSVFGDVSAGAKLGGRNNLPYRFRLSGSLLIVIPPKVRRVLRQLGEALGPRL